MGGLGRVSAALREARKHRASSVRTEGLLGLGEGGGEVGVAHEVRVEAALRHPHSELFQHSVPLRIEEAHGDSHASV